MCMIETNTPSRLWILDVLLCIYSKRSIEHAGDLKHEEKRRKKRVLIKPCTFFLQGSLWFVFRAPGNHETDDSSCRKPKLSGIYGYPIQTKTLQIALLTQRKHYNTDKSHLANILFQVREMFHEKLIQPLNRQPAACYITGILNCEYKHLFFKKSERWIVPWCTLTVCNKLQALQVFKKMI